MLYSFYIFKKQQQWDEIEKYGSMFSASLVVNVHAHDANI